jgi:hypothetical protein
MQSLAARIETLESGKRGVESRVAEAKQVYEDTERRLASIREKPEPEVKEEVKPQPKVATADDFISNAPRPTQAWLKEHRRFAEPGTKEHKKLHAFAAEYLADHDDDASALNSEAFREALDAKFFPQAKETAVAEETEPETVRETPKQRPRPAAAPVVRSGEIFSSKNMQAGKVRLPPRLAAQVKAAGLDATKYALECVELIKKGELPKTFLDNDHDHSY